MIQKINNELKQLNLKLKNSNNQEIFKIEKRINVLSDVLIILKRQLKEKNQGLQNK
jgi:hypothetical protein